MYTHRLMANECIDINSLTPLSVNNTVIGELWKGNLRIQTCAIKKFLKYTNDK